MKSHSLRGAESLSRLLQYCAKQSLEHPDELLKEYQIARGVYGRGPDFDPQSDSCVRVQAGRLRLKLAEYYAKEGVNDPVVVKLPKGGYHLIFEAKSAAADSHSVTSTPTVASAPTPSSYTLPAPWRFTLIASLTCLLASLAAVAVLLRSRKTTDPSVASAHELSAASTPLAEFWRPFTTKDEPWVVFSNAAFVGRPETGMRYQNSKDDARTSVYDHYTGVGEVLAVHALDEAFASLGRKILVKRGSLFTLDNANNNLIFLGSPSENLSLLDIPGTQEFIFERVTSGARKGDLSIVSRHPKSGEASAYLASPSSSPLTEDYAVVGLVPGVNPGRLVMILAGTTTFGTQGAVEFVCRPDSVGKLLQQIPGAGSGQVRPFEALVRVKIARGVPLETELVSIRAREQ